jgi:hypothetical protein
VRAAGVKGGGGMLGNISRHVQTASSPLVTVRHSFHTRTHLLDRPRPDQPAAARNGRGSFKRTRMREIGRRVASKQAQLNLRAHTPKMRTPTRLCARTHKFKRTRARTTLCRYLRVLLSLLQAG